MQVAAAERGSLESNTSFETSCMATKRPSLGRGLEALLGTPTALASAMDDDDSDVAVAAPPRDHELANLPVDLLQRGRYQPRLDMRAR